MTITRSTLGLLALGSLALALVACAPKDKSAIDPILDGGAIPSAAQVQKDSGIVLQNNAGLYIETSKGMEWKASATIMEVLELRGRSKKAIRVSDGAERDFVQVKNRQGDEYWIQDFFLATEAVGAVVLTEDTILFKGPDAAQATSNKLPQYHLIAVHPETSTDGFIEVSAYVEGGSVVVVDELWVKAEKVSQVPKDVRAMQLYAVSQAKTDTVVKTEILKSALELNSVFNPMIQTAFDALTSTTTEAAPEASTETRAEETWNSPATINDDKVNIRDLPNEKGSNVIGSLDSGTPITISKRTVSTYNVGGQDAYWYYLPDFNGWVFGSFVTLP